MTKVEKPTQARLHELFSYDAETGIFLRKSGSRRGPKDRKYGRVGAGRISELGYVLLMIDGINYIAGQVAWAYTHGDWPHARIKYLNGNKIDNRIENIGLQDAVKDDVKAAPLSCERLKELMHYEPLTGWFTWRIPSSTCKPGERAGTVHGLGYRQIGLDYKKFLEHKLAWLYMTGEWPSSELDHINKNKSDNAWSNLRESTRSLQGHNKSMGTRNTSGFPGVYLHGSKVRARLTLDGKTKDYGWFKTIAEARIARLLGEKETFGKFTSFDDARDGILPLGDKFIVIFSRDNKLFVQDANGNPQEITDVKQIEVLPVNDTGEVLQ